MNFFGSTKQDTPPPQDRLCDFADQSIGRSRRNVFPLHIKERWRTQHRAVRGVFLMLFLVHLGTAFGWLYWHFFGR